MLIIFLFIVCMNTVLGAKLPPSLQRCKYTDNACLKNAIQDALPIFAKGIRSLGVQGMDPLYMPLLEISSGAGSVKIDQKVKNAFVHGLSKVEIDSVEFQLGTKPQTINLKYHTSNITIEGDYEMNGNILVFPVKGSGKMRLYIENMVGDESVKLKVVKREDKDYLQLGETILKMDAGRVVFDLENLFDGNKQMSDQINRVLNENWKSIFDELKHGYNDGIKAFLDNMTNRFFSQIPMWDIFLE